VIQTDCIFSWIRFAFAEDWEFSLVPVHKQLWFLIILTLIFLALAR